ncbi:hypothetical protein X975_04670, partial [Stegodyphus mimosarum]
MQTEIIKDAHEKGHTGIKHTEKHLKLRAKYFGPYKITKVKGGNTYDVIKEGCHEGPMYTTTCAEFLKKWTAL